MKNTKTRWTIVCSFLAGAAIGCSASATVPTYIMSDKDAIPVSGAFKGMPGAGTGKAASKFGATPPSFDSANEKDMGKPPPPKKSGD